MLYLLKHSGRMTLPPKWVKEGNYQKFLDYPLLKPPPIDLQAGAVEEEAEVEGAGWAG